MFSSLIWLALGAFAIGTEGFMISGILPGMARDLGVSIATAGQLVTIFAFAYAVGTPLIAIATATLPRRALLLAAMAAFSIANLLAACAPNYLCMAGARIMLALAAGTFMPAAGAYAASTATPERRGRALAFIYSGMTMALVLGVPLGALLAARSDWRATFAGVAALGLAALFGMAAKLKAAPPPAAVSLGQRLATARRADVLSILLLTTLIIMGAFSVNTYFGAYLEELFGLSANGVAGFLFVMGLAAAAGNTLGGRAADRWDARQFLRLAIAMIALAFVLIGALALFAPQSWALALLLVAVVLWNLFAWSTPSVQQTRLVSVDPQLAPVTLGLNSSAIYLGAAIGAALGSTTIQLTSLSGIGAIGALCEFGALMYLTATRPGPAKAMAASCPVTNPEAVAAGLH